MLFLHKKSFFVRHRYSFAVLLLAGITILVSTLLGDSFGFAYEREAITEYFRSLGFLAPIVFTIVVAIEVIIAPLPGGILTVAAPVLFGPILGTLYSWLGNVIGSMAAFAIARRYGLTIVKKLMPHFNEHSYRKNIQENQTLFWFAYVTPLVPVDVFSFALGLSNIGFNRFSVNMSIGFLIRISMITLFSDSLADLLLT